MEEKKTLEQLIEESSSGDFKEQLGSLIKNMKDNEGSKLNAFLDVLKGVIDSQKELTTAINNMASALEDIKNRPDPKFPEFPKQKDFPSEMKITKPSWWKDPQSIDFEGIMKKHANTIKSHISQESEATNGILMAILGKEPEQLEVIASQKKDSPRTVNSAAVRSRRTTQWRIATFPQVAGTLAMISAGDGFNYYLPDSCISNSETGRLNGGLPLSHGVDYTISGNKITFQENQNGSLQEWRWQNK